MYCDLKFAQIIKTTYHKSHKNENSYSYDFSAVTEVSLSVFFPSKHEKLLALFCLNLGFKLKIFPGLISLRIFTTFIFVKTWRFTKFPLKKVGFRNFLDPLWDFVIKIILRIVIPTFHDNLLVQKITKCGDPKRQKMAQSAQTKC